MWQELLNDRDAAAVGMLEALRKSGSSLSTYTPGLVTTAEEQRLPVPQNTAPRRLVRLGPRSTALTPRG